MGNVVRGATGYFDVWQMNTFAKMDYHLSQRQVFAAVAAQKQQEMLAQLGAAGLMSGGTGVTASAGNTATLWVRWNNFIFQNAGSMCAVALILAGLSYLVKEIALMGAATWLFVFALQGYVSQATLSGSKRMEVYTSRIISSAAIIGLVAAVAVFITLEPHFSGKKPKEEAGDQSFFERYKALVIGGALVLCLAAFFHFRKAAPVAQAEQIVQQQVKQN